MQWPELTLGLFFTYLSLRVGWIQTRTIGGILELVIGLIGPIAAGKETFVALLREALVRIELENKLDDWGFSVKQVSTGLVLRRTLELWNLPVTRENLQSLPVVMEKAFGKGVLSNSQRPAMESCSEHIVVYDSIRWESDLEVVRSFPNVIVYINASLENRWLRAKARKEKSGEEFMTLEEFKEREKQTTETEIRRLSRHANFILFNDGSIEDFREKVYGQVLKYPFVRQFLSENRVSEVSRV